MNILKTEDEARKCWCPFARVAWQGTSNSFNRTGGSIQEPSGEVLPETPAVTLCLASHCMAWRRGEERAEKPVGLEPAGDGWVKDGPPTGAGGAVTHRQNWKRQAGYCGLAGKPDGSR